jgi:AcrR family transcriptional regulator
MTVDGRVVRGDRTRASVLDTAVSLATEAGLDGLSLSQLAERLGVSKSGLFAHWRTKEELQLAAIERAREGFTESVLRPALAAPRGVRRLWAMHERRLAHLAESGLPGGCFFVNTQFEYDARTGPVRDRLARALGDWLALIERLVTEAVAARELPADVDPAQLAFEIDAAGVAAVYQSRLRPAVDVLALARAAVLRRLRELCPDPSLLPEA